MSDTTFDYIIVGAGTSGCVIANRLTEDSNVSVLLLEAGPADTKPEIHDPHPYSIVKLFGSEVDWAYFSEEQPGLNGRKIMCNRGKVLGGSSATHAMIHIRGNRRDFDHWNYLGNDGWGYQDVLPYFKKSEDYHGDPSDYQGTGGPLSVRYMDVTPAATAITNAAVELGFAGPDNNFNAEQHEETTGAYQFNITPEGKRASLAVAFLTPIKDQRANLTIQTEALATRILIEDGKAVGVEYVQNGNTVQAKAAREVIVSGGTINSPQLLMLSGIGPAETLKAHNIPVVADLPGVGQNLQDHLRMPVLFKVKEEQPIPVTFAEVGILTRTRPDASEAAPDLQLNMNSTIPGTLPDYCPDKDSPGITFMSITSRPKSTGYVTLRSNNPTDPPIINPNYLQCEADVQVQLKGIELCRKLVKTQAFSHLYDGEQMPGEDKSPEELEHYVRNECQTIWHFVGTCKMGLDAMAVVDPQLRVYGVQGLRVADASIMPTIVSSNTNAACAMIGEKVSDMIKQA